MRLLDAMIGAVQGGLKHGADSGIEPKSILALSTLAFCLAAVVGPHSIGAQQPLARLEPSDCAFTWPADRKVDCAWLVLPEVPSRPNGATVKLAVAVVRARNPAGRTPLVYLHGGPGGTGVATGQMVGISDIPGLGDRDVVFWDQRSSGRSQPRLCPEYDESLNARRNEITRETGPAIRKPLIQLCIASLKAKNIDPTSYNTTSSAHDLAALKQALGYTKWIVYGASYGSLLAQEAMRVDPSGIESVILGQPVPPGDLNEADGPISMQRSLERVFRACVAQPECHTAFPTVEQDFYALYQALRERPYAFVTATGDSVVLHVDRFRSVVNDYLMRTPTLAQLPLLFHEMLRGDKLRAARVLVPSLAPARLSNRALANLVNCYDTDEATFNRMVDSANAQVKEPFRRSRESGECSMWQEGFSARARTPVVSEIPTLILAGEFDPRTPVEHGQRIARTLSRAYVFEVPGRSHQNPTPCERSMIAAFIADPVRKPDAACLASLPPITFQTHW